MDGWKRVSLYLVSSSLFQCGDFLFHLDLVKTLACASKYFPCPLFSPFFPSSSFSPLLSVSHPFLSPSNALTVTFTRLLAHSCISHRAWNSLWLSDAWENLTWWNRICSTWTHIIPTALLSFPPPSLPLLSPPFFCLSHIIFFYWNTFLSTIWSWRFFHLEFGCSNTLFYGYRKGSAQSKFALMPDHIILLQEYEPSQKYWVSRNLLSKIPLSDKKSRVSVFKVSQCFVIQS